MSVFEQRRERLSGAVAAEGLDAFLVSNPVNVSYLTGFSGEASPLILFRGRWQMVSDGRFVGQLADECPDLPVFIRTPSQTVVQAVVEELKRMKPTSVGTESAFQTVAEAQALSDGVPGATWKPAPDRVEKLRMVKDVDEQSAIRRAIRIAERAFAMFRAMLKPSDTEKDLVDRMEQCVRWCGGTQTAFPVIAAVGSRAALPHAPPTDRRLDESFLLLVDWGATERFYKSDLTRVLWGPNQSPTLPDDVDRLRLLFEIVGEAQRRAISALRPGVKTTDVDAIARGYISEKGYGEQFNHGLGHGFGLNIHEAPFFRPSTPVTLEAGMVVTMEPGIYLTGWGGVRIEDDILITPDGPEVLTTLPRGFDESRWDLGI